MYEPEVNRIQGEKCILTADTQSAFADLPHQLLARSVLPWGEHCTECNWPSCYTTCELYSPRIDGACRLFVDGMVRVDLPESANGYVLKIRFKQWGKLWTIGNTRLFSPQTALRKERREIRIGAVSRILPLPRALKGTVVAKVNYRRRQEAERNLMHGGTPDFFVVECFNPERNSVDLTVTIRNRGASGVRPFLANLTLIPGYSRGLIPFPEISALINVLEPFEIEMVPNGAKDTLLYFGLMDFIKTKGPALRGAKQGVERKWKCIVWDLDNTLWRGTLIEDGAEKLRLSDSIVSAIRETDRRGILHSIASKNNREDALRVLRDFGLEKYFLHPEISWEPKSQSIRRIAERLNIGLDSIAFVDDQPFEREEVKVALPEVSVLDVSECSSIASFPECDVPVTDESRRRREMYRQQAERQSLLSARNGDYVSFLRECRIQLEVESLGESNLERVYELAQRTNQMNYSGNRYAREELQTLLVSADRDAFVFRCSDRFGSYGIVGFGVVDQSEPRLLDLMFSCRIQGKRVEHAVVAFLLRKYLPESKQGFHANYKWTEKNAASGKVFEDLGFACLREAGNLRCLEFSRERPVPEDGIVEIIDKIEGD